MADPAKKDDALASAVRDAFQKHMEEARHAALAAKGLKPSALEPPRPANSTGTTVSRASTPPQEPLRPSLSPFGATEARLSNARSSPASIDPPRQPDPSVYDGSERGSRASGDGLFSSLRGERAPSLPPMPRLQPPPAVNDFAARKAAAERRDREETGARLEPAPAARETAPSRREPDLSLRPRASAKMPSATIDPLIEARAAPPPSLPRATPEIPRRTEPAMPASPPETPRALAPRMPANPPPLPDRRTEAPLALRAPPTPRFGSPTLDTNGLRKPPASLNRSEPRPDFADLEPTPETKRVALSDRDDFAPALTRSDDRDRRAFDESPAVRLPPPTVAQAPSVQRRPTPLDELRADRAAPAQRPEPDMARRARPEQRRRPVRAAEVAERPAGLRGLVSGRNSLVLVGLGAAALCLAIIAVLLVRGPVTTPPQNGAARTVPAETATAATAARPQAAPAAAQTIVTRPVKTVTITLDDIDLSIQEAREKVAAGDVKSARLMLAGLQATGDPRILMAMGETFDPALARDPAYADPGQALRFYEAAQQAGVAGAADRVTRLSTGSN